MRNKLALCAAVLCAFNSTPAYADQTQLPAPGVYTTSLTPTAPLHAGHLYVIGCGGGGGGRGGNTQSGIAGGAGAGARKPQVPVHVLIAEGDQLWIAIGNGGIGGARSLPDRDGYEGGNGSDGEPTVVKIKHQGASDWITIVEFPERREPKTIRALAKAIHGLSPGRIHQFRL